MLRRIAWFVTRAALAVVVGLACSACRRSTPARPSARLVEIRVIDRAPAGDDTVEVDALAARVAEKFRRSNVLPVAPGVEPVRGVDWRLRVDVGVDVAGNEERGALRAVIDARMSRVGAEPGDPSVDSRGIAERETKRGEGRDRAARRAHLERALDDVVGALVAKVKLREGSGDEVAAALATGDAEVRAEAMRVAAERKHPEAVPALIRLLKSEEAGERDRAMGALIEIGDRRAVKPIIEAAKFRDVAELPKAIDALAALGGDEARAWLEFVANGHGDAEIRELAKEALGRLDRRAAPR